MAIEFRDFGLTLTASSNNSASYQRLYKPGQFPGVADSTNRVYGQAIQFFARAYFPTDRSGNGTFSSKRNLAIVKRLTSSSLNIICSRYTFGSSPGDQTINLNSLLGASEGVGIGADWELGILLNENALGLLSGSEQISIFGYAWEDNKI